MITTVHTQKSVYSDHETFLSEKEKLFHNLSIKIIINELKNNNICIKVGEIVEIYRQNYDINKTIDIFDQRFDKELDQLALKNEVFDDDALVYLIIKVIEHEFDIHSVPDIVYIANDIKDLLHQEQPYLSVLKHTQKIMKRLQTLSQYVSDRDLQNMFAPYGIDIEQFFVRVFQEINTIDDVQLLKKLYELLTALMQTYHLSKRYCDIQLELISAIVIYDQSEIDHYLQQIEKDNPDYLLMTYYKIINALTEIEKKELVQHYLNMAIAYVPENEEQKDLLDIIKEIFS